MNQDILCQVAVTNNTNQCTLFIIYSGKPIFLIWNLSALIKTYNITINKTSVEEGIDEELKNILQTCASLDQQNFIKVKELKETSLEN